jgi:Uma2 family endonuclease
MAVVSPKPSPLRMTWEEFLAWGGEDTRAEWVDGEVIILSPTNRKHQKRGRFIDRLVQEYVETHALGEVFSDSFLMRLPYRPSGRIPDILFVSNEHLSKVTDTYVDGPADLAIEVVSPDSKRRDREEKLVEYEESGVSEYWWIDDTRREAHFYQRGDDGRYQEVRPDDQGIYRSVAVPGFWLNLEWLWNDPPPTMREIRKAWALDQPEAKEE